MPKIAPILTNIAVNHLKRVGWHAVGGVAGLLLQIRKPEREGAPSPRSWILRISIGGQRQPIGLGPFPQVSLAEAREQAKKLVAQVRQGVDPKALKKSTRSALLSAAAKNKTFKKCAESYMEAHHADYTSDKHRKQWPSTLEAYAHPLIGNMLVADITMRHVLDVLVQSTKSRDGASGKLWYTKTETAKRLLGRIKTILDYAIVNEYRTGTNPAVWKGFLDTQLPSPRKVTQQTHHPAVPYAHIGVFMAQLRLNGSISAKALEFLILTAVRSGSVRLATWSEIDFKQKLWVIPAAHTKIRKEHRVPLQNQAIRLLCSLPRIAGNSKIFPSPRGSHLSDMALSQLMRGMRERGELKVEGVPHGFRSTFRDWAADRTSYSDEIRKVASGHSVGDAVKQAYQRTDLLEKRRQLMAAWASFLDRAQFPQTASITPIRNLNGCKK
jgi:integrase